MARYTTEVRTICEFLVGLEHDVGLSATPEVISKARQLIFDFDYPIFDKSYKSVLETKILEHYYFREIGLENYGKWKFFMARKLKEIMPYYNQLYESQLIKFNPMYDVDVERTHNRTEDEKQTAKGSHANTVDTTGESTNDGTTMNHSTTNNTNDDAFSDTPQGSLSGVADLQYLTTYRKITDTGSNDEDNNYTNDQKMTSNVKDNGTTTNDATINTTEDYIEHVIGKQGSTSYSKLLNEFRDTFLNIDVMIIDEVSELFMNIY